MGASATPEINFATKDELSGRPGGKFVHWALTYGKAVIVLTELVVVSLFISRFWLDSKKADLGESIDRKSAIVASSADFEKRFLALINRIEKAKAIMTKVSPGQILSLSKELLPEGIVANNISISGNRILIEGTSQKEESLAVLSRSFKDSARFTNVDLRKVTKDVDKSKVSGISFALSADYLIQKEEGGN